jgi:hypothetical protein
VCGDARVGGADRGTAMSTGRMVDENITIPQFRTPVVLSNRGPSNSDTAAGGESAAYLEEDR